MKRFIGIVIGLLVLLPFVARPAMAQEDGGGRVSMGSGDFDGTQFGDDGSGQRNRRDAGAPAPSPLDPIRQVLTNAGLPLTLEEEKSLQGIVETQQAAQQAAQEAAPQASGQAGSGGQRAAGSGGSGASGGGRGPGRGSGRDNALQEKLVAALSAEQQAAWKKYQRDQIIAHGGYPALRLALEEAGSPPSPEQDTQLQAQFRAYDEQQRELRAAAGAGAPPDAAKMKELETQHLSLLIKMLDTVQRKALLDWRRSAQNQNSPR